MGLDSLLRLVYTARLVSLDGLAVGCTESKNLYSEIIVSEKLMSILPRELHNAATCKLDLKTVIPNQRGPVFDQYHGVKEVLSKVR